MKKEGGGEAVLESRHVVGMFLFVVVLCSVFFTLGYVMGRTQFDASLRAVASAKPAPAAAPASAPKPARPDNLSSGGATDTPELEVQYSPAAKTVAPAAKPAEARTEPAATTPPRPSTGAASTARGGLVKSPAIPRGGVVLQVAALRSEVDALALAEVLQQKEFPAFVLTPEGNGLYRVQVGPYESAKAADAVKKALEREGFKAISKR